MSFIENEARYEAAKQRNIRMNRLIGNRNRWVAESGKEIVVLEGHTASVGSAAFSPDGKWAVSGGQDHSVRAWELGSGREVLRLNLKSTPSAESFSLGTSTRSGAGLAWASSSRA